ncbi:tRNA (cytidine(34)-2'-O)-methyltransferase [Desulfoplanes formicivorans]|uniref:Putative tRNA (cytidine(34)-2'-O)-methyltransferase n=1 Tax=Desulfoplanes formicivorans TaxID=1592317 RepID=A0A194AIF0_9BACT|nr:tRNA (cytidine(34)-2'-O)-methyltransferase [Desulfoplanes formicivorans]GAU08534.1 tRNA methyltransferase [Desulfoplanes formicivorans]
MQIALYEPEIPPNTGTIARLCAAVTTPLNLIEPLGFSLDDRYLKRAGLDYWPHVDVRVWKNWSSFTASLDPCVRLIMTSARKGQPHHTFSFHTKDIIVLGPETRGLPGEIMDQADYLVRIPIWGQVRSINLANCASILLYEGLRQTGELDSH